METTTDTTRETAMVAQIRRLRSALARIEGSARYGIERAQSTADRASFAWIAEECAEALAGEG